MEKVLEITLHDGTDPKTGYHFVDLEKRAEDCGSVRELMELYKQTPGLFYGPQVETEHINDEIHIQQDINAFRSSPVVYDCIERAMDLVEGRFRVLGGTAAYGGNHQRRGFPWQHWTRLYLIRSF